MKTIFYKKVSVLIILSAFTILGACNKQTSLTSSDNNNNYTPVKNSEVLFSKMESYTPILINRGTKAFIDDIEKGIAIDPKKYENLFSDILEKIGQEGKIINLDSIPNILNKLWKLLDKSEYLFWKQKLEDNDISILDKNIIQLINSVHSQEKVSAAFYSSLIKSAIIYYVNNQNLIEHTTNLLKHNYQMITAANEYQITIIPISHPCGRGERKKLIKNRLTYGYLKENGMRVVGIGGAILGLFQGLFGQCDD